MTAGALLLALGCTRVDKERPDKTPRPQGTHELGVAVAITSAVLDEDCQIAQAGDADETREAKRAPMTEAEMQAAEADRACRQSRVSFKLVSGAGDTAARIELVSVKLHDDKGKYLQDLVARNPQQWSAADSQFHPWDLHISPSQELNVGFDLTAPDWDKIGGGSRWNTEGLGFKLSVTVRIDGKERSVDTTVMSPFFTRETMIET